MRFTKIPLIATLMAVALSLLIVLPALAVSGDRTNGRLGSGDWLDVRVADNIDDLDNTAGDNSPTSLVGGTGAYAIDAEGSTGNQPFNARDTYFGGTLYVSNQEDAYNSFLITAKVPATTGTTSNVVTTGPTGVLDNVSTGTADAPVDESMGTCVSTDAAVATIKNLRSGVSAKALLLRTTQTEGSPPIRIYQGLAAVWDQEDAIEKHDGPCAAHVDPVKFVVGNTLDTQYDNATADPPITNGDGSKNPEDGWNPNSAAVIPARDGDVISITVKGVNGQISLVVDGDNPSIDDVSPASGVQNKETVSLGFTVKDDGAGIRYDGESGDSTDGDNTPFNGDNDQNMDEPITSTGLQNDQVVAGDGSTMDISVDFTGMVDKTYNPCISACDDGSSDTDVLTVPGKTRDDTQDAGSVVMFEDKDAIWHADAESSRFGNNDWVQVTKGVEYSLDMRIGANPFGTYYWQISAMDRVGNKAVTDSDEDEKGAQPYSFKVDDAQPEVTSARTGIGYEVGKGEFTDRSWIALNFENVAKGGADRIDASTVDASDFTVGGSTVMNALNPTEGKVCKADDDDTDAKEDAKNIKALDATDDLGCNFEPRARVYLQLTEPLDSDATPTIQLLGGVIKDIAGNNNRTQSINKATDRIAPGVSISVTSSSGATGRAATDSKGSFTVRVTSDEELRGFPELFFATLQGTATSGVANDPIMIRKVEAESLSEKETNIWEAKVKVSNLVFDGTANEDRLLAVIVTAEDDERNKGNSKGWEGTGAEPGAGDKLDFKNLDAGGFLVEVDSSFEPATIEVLPPTDPDATKKDKTESMNPYIQITFPKEAKEYGIDLGSSDTANKAAIKDGKPSSTDSHADVTITSLTLNGEDRLAEIVRVKAGEYVLAVTGLAVGEYDIVYAARDDVGNDIKADDSDAKFTFEVQERQPYKVALDPGWNLVSLPGDPFNPAVGEVIGGSLKADTVLGYQGGEWVTAVRNEDGRWQGTLATIQGGYGYWVRTTALESISTVIPPTLPTSVLPTVPVVSGWNLLGVIDAEQRKAGTKQNVDEYLTSLNQWRVAYGFSTQVNQWTKLLPGTTHTVANGKGYWVWSTTPGTLVP